MEIIKTIIEIIKSGLMILGVVITTIIIFLLVGLIYAMPYIAAGFVIFLALKYWGLI